MTEEMYDSPPENVRAILDQSVGDMDYNLCQTFTLPMNEISRINNKKQT